MKAVKQEFARVFKQFLHGIQTRIRVVCELMLVNERDFV